MTISLGGYGFESISTHGLPQEGMYGSDNKVNSFCGVEGAVEITDLQHEREIRIDADFLPYATEALMLAALATIDGKVGLLKDSTLTVVSASGSTMTYTHVTFRGYARNGSMYSYKDGANTRLRQDGTLIFIQLKRTA